MFANLSHFGFFDNIFRPFRTRKSKGFSMRHNLYRRKNLLILLLKAPAESARSPLFGWSGRGGNPALPRYVS